MRISSDGVNFIKQHEGVRLEAYQDSVGVWTIGWGHTRNVTPHTRITLDEAERLLLQDLEEVEACVSRHVDVELTQGQFDALCSFVFNLGCGAFKKSTMLRDINAGRMEDAAHEMLRWSHAGGQVVASLLKRREAESEMFMA